MKSEKKGEIKKKINNRLMYSLISLGIIILLTSGIYGVINPLTDAYHNSDMINFSSINISATSDNALIIKEKNWSSLSRIFFSEGGSSLYGAYVGYNAIIDGLEFNTLENGVEKKGIFITRSLGNMGIGTSSPSYKLQVEGDLNADAFLYDSDLSLKQNVLPLQNSLDKLKQLQGVSFNWKDSNKPGIGLIAQDVEKIYPELVHTSQDGLKSVEYGNVVAILIEAVKEQQKEIDELKSQLKK